MHPLQTLFHAVMALFLWANFALLLWAAVMQRIPVGSAVPAVLAGILFFLLAMFYSSPLMMRLRKDDGK